MTLKLAETSVLKSRLSVAYGANFYIMLVGAADWVPSVAGPDAPYSSPINNFGHRAACN